MAISISAISATTKQFFFPKLADNVATSMSLLMQMKKKGRMTSIDGGDVINVPLTYARNASAMNYSGGEILNTAANEKVTSMQFGYCQKNIAMSITGLDQLKNAGNSKVIDKIQSEVKMAERDLKNSFATGMYSAGTDTKELVGARVFCSASNSYGGLSQSTESWLQSRVDATTTTVSLGAIKTVYELAREDEDAVDVITMTGTLFGSIWSLMQPQQRYSNESMARAGFSNLMFESAVMLEDSYVPAGIYGFNTSHLQLAGLGDRGFPGKFVDWESPVNQDVIVAHIRFAGQLICEEPRKQFLMSAVTS